MLTLIQPRVVETEDEARFRGRTGQLQDLINFNNTHVENEDTVWPHSNTPQTEQSKPGVYLRSIMERFLQGSCRSAKKEQKSKLNKY